MLRRVQMGMIGIALCGLSCVSDCSIRAGTMITLSLAGNASIGIQFNGADLSSAAGRQNTAAEFVDFMDWCPDIVTSTASFTITGLMASNPPNLYGGSSIVQQFAGGTFSQYDAANTLLLSGNLATSALAGTVGLPNGGLFTTSFSTVIGGTLAPYLDPETLVLQMHLWNINRGEGFSVGPTAPPAGAKLDPFTADVTVDVAAQPITADFNHNGVVDAADYTIWRETLGYIAIPPFYAGDADGDGDVDHADYLAWKRQFGRFVPPPATSAAVPEPSVGTALILGTMLVLIARGLDRRVKKTQRRDDKLRSLCSTTNDDFAKGGAWLDCPQIQYHLL